MFESKESELHRVGKSILYNYFYKRYPDANVYAEYKLPNGRRADVFVEFDSKQRLAIEFQNSSLPYNIWQERHNDYEKLSIKDIWFLCGEEEKFQNMILHNNLTFMEQIMLYETKEKCAVYLDVYKGKLTFLKQMRYLLDNGDLLEEKIFHKTYSLSEVIILKNGETETDFFECFLREKVKFDEKCKKRIDDFRKLKPYPEVHKKTSSANISSKYKRPTSQEYNLYIRKALDGNKYYKNKLIYLLSNAGTDEVTMVRNLFVEFHNKGSNVAAKIYLELKKKLNWIPSWSTNDTPSVGNDNSSTLRTNINPLCKECRFFEIPEYSQKCERQSKLKNCLSFSPRF